MNSADSHDDSQNGGDGHDDDDGELRISQSETTTCAQCGAYRFEHQPCPSCGADAGTMQRRLGELESEFLAEEAARSRGGWSELIEDDGGWPVWAYVALLLSLLLVLFSVFLWSWPGHMLKVSGTLLLVFGGVAAGGGWWWLRQELGAASSSLPLQHLARLATLRPASPETPPRSPPVDLCMVALLAMALGVVLLLSGLAYEAIVK